MDCVMYNVYLLVAFLLVSFKKCCLNKVFFPVNVANVFYYIQYVYTVLHPAIFSFRSIGMGAQILRPSGFGQGLSKTRPSWEVHFRSIQITLILYNFLTVSKTIAGTLQFCSNTKYRYRYAQKTGCNPAVVLGRNFKNNGY